MLDVSQSDIRIIYPFNAKTLNLNRKETRNKKPSSCYNLTFFPLEKAKNFFKVNNRSIKLSYKSPRNSKSQNIPCFSKNPSELSNTEQEKTKNSISILNKSNMRIRTISSKQKAKKGFISNFKKLSINRYNRANISKQRQFSEKCNMKKGSIYKSLYKSYTKSQSDDIIRGDFIPEEQRKKMLFDNVDSIMADEEKRSFFGCFSEKGKKISGKIDKRIKPIIKECENLVNNNNKSQLEFSSKVNIKEKSFFGNKWESFRYSNKQF